MASTRLEMGPVGQTEVLRSMALMGRPASVQAVPASDHIVTLQRTAKVMSALRYLKAIAPRRDVLQAVAPRGLSASSSKMGIHTVFACATTARNVSQTKSAIRMGLAGRESPNCPPVTAPLAALVLPIATARTQVPYVTQRISMGRTPAF